MDIKDIPVGAAVGFKLPRSSIGKVGRVVAVSDSLVAIKVACRETISGFAAENERLNQLAWPGCPEGVLLLHHSYVLEAF